MEQLLIRTPWHMTHHAHSYEAPLYADMASVVAAYAELEPGQVGGEEKIEGKSGGEGKVEGKGECRGSERGEGVGKDVGEEGAESGTSAKG